MRRRTALIEAIGILLGVAALPAAAEPARCTVGKLLELKVTMAGDEADGDRRHQWP